MTSKMAEQIINTTVSKAHIFPAGVARCFGNIEGIIDDAFDKETPLEILVQQIEERLTEIKGILNEQKTAY